MPNKPFATVISIVQGALAAAILLNWLLCETFYCVEAFRSIHLILAIALAYSTGYRVGREEGKNEA